MSIVITATARVKDWKQLEQVHQEQLLVAAQENGALRYEIYRNIYDASQVMLFIELPDEDAVPEIGYLLSQCLALLQCEEQSREYAWEAMNWKPTV